MTSMSFYLLKPDALVRRDVVLRAEKLLGGVTIVEERDVVLTAPQVSALWAENRSELHPIASAFLELYLVGQTSRLVTVDGDGALETVILLKRQLRREYSQGAFANVVHAPSDAWENEDHAAILGERERPPKPGTGLQGIPAAANVTSLTADEVRRAVLSVWQQVQEEGWASLAVRAPSEPAAAWLVADDVHSMDSAVSALWDALPQLSLRGAITRVCEAERTGQALVIAGSVTVVSVAAERLRARDLRVQMSMGAASQAPML
jgi:hypothetical protein